MIETTSFVAANCFLSIQIFCDDLGECGTKSCSKKDFSTKYMIDSLTRYEDDKVARSLRYTMCSIHHIDSSAQWDKNQDQFSNIVSLIRSFLPMQNASAE